MKMLESKYPKMGTPQRKFINSMLLTYFEYFLEVGEDGVCKEILEDQADLSIYPYVQKRIDEYVKQQSAGEHGTI